MISLLAQLRGATFRRQISLTVAGGVLLLTIFASLASSLQGARRIRDTLLHQGANVTGNLAEQSRLALLFGSAENANDALQATLAFPDVIAVEIVDVTGNVLVRKAKREGEQPFVVGTPKLVSNNVALTFENDDVWSFSAPVVTESNDDSPFETNERKKETLGVVQVMQSKATLKSLRNSIFLTNFLVSTLFALLFLVAIRALTKRLTRPLNDLADSMALAESGERSVRAPLHGARDLVVMARAFNRMISVLEDRERELIESRDVAIAFAQLKSQFAATVSHEIRTPLNGVIGTLDMLMASTLPSRQHQFVELAWDSARYLLDLINDVLDFSRLEAGKVVLDALPLDLAQLIEGVVDTLASQAHQKGLEIGYAIAMDTPAQLIGDARRLRQVLTNLVGNAVKFTQSGEIGVRAQYLRQNGVEYLHIEVLDTGPGVDSSLHTHIFESFTQGDAFSTRRFEGSGLGLAICRELVKLMNGTIGVNSQLGEGSSFWFQVPLQSIDNQTVAPRSPVIQRALIVDRNEITHEFCASTLPKLGFSSEHCTELAAARRLLHDAQDSGRPYDIVLVDHGMGSTAEQANMPSEFTGAAHKWIVMAPLTQPNPTEFSTWDAVLPKPLRIQRMAACLRTSGQDNIIEHASPAIRFSGVVRVLVVEDNRTNQAVTLGMLSMLGATAEIAVDGRAALDAFGR
ncbi:MAG TPA: ATP-binding protein, partial [Rhodocyclaceae bacterium]|nr:ATP-binding protein [Rhodocyclaceae bacterium]